MCFRSSFCIYIPVKNFPIHHSLGPFPHASFMSHFFTSTLHINWQGHGFLHLHATSSLLWLIMNILHLVLLYFWGVPFVCTYHGWVDGEDKDWGLLWNLHEKRSMARYKCVDERQSSESDRYLMKMMCVWSAVVWSQSRAIFGFAVAPFASGRSRFSQAA